MNVQAKNGQSSLPRRRTEKQRSRILTGMERARDQDDVIEFVPVSGVLFFLFCLQVYCAYNII